MQAPLILGAIFFCAFVGSEEGYIVQLQSNPMYSEYNVKSDDYALGLLLSIRLQKTNLFQSYICV